MLCSPFNTEREVLVQPRPSQLEKEKMIVSRIEKGGGDLIKLEIWQGVFRDRDRQEANG